MYFLLEMGIFQPAMFSFTRGDLNEPVFSQRVLLVIFMPKIAAFSTPGTTSSLRAALMCGI